MFHPLENCSLQELGAFVEKERILVADLEIDAEIEQAFGTSRREFVFNTTPDDTSDDTSGDRRRLQAALVGDLGEGILAGLRSELEAADLHIGQHTINTLVALKSLPGCDQQACHTDLDTDLLADCTTETMPLLVLVALMIVPRILDD